MTSGIFNVPAPQNEPIKGYLPGSPERASLKAELARQASEVVTIPLIIGGKEVYTDTYKEIVMPHNHSHVLARYCVAGKEELAAAIDAAIAAKAEWDKISWEHRAAIFLKVGDLIAGPYRDKINAATMLGQSKTVFQAEIDSACELADFFRFNVHCAEQIYHQQPASTRGVWNRVEYRPLDGFVMAISPFNFTSIGGNLPCAPAIMGNTVLWKPSSTAVLSNYVIMEALREAGIPDGVINFIPSKGSDISKYVLTHPKMAGFHFTGSTEVFSGVWKTVGENIRTYESYPRLVGETGGKDFIFAHASADVDALAAAMVRGAYEYQGQKCSAASRAFVPASIWGEVKEKVAALVKTLKVGDVCDFTTFMGAVIDKASFDNIKGYIDRANVSADAEVVFGSYDDSVGYFVYPTLIEAKTPDYESMVKEIFGPVLTVYVYDDDKLDETLHICDTASPYGLTGAIFARERSVIQYMEKALTNTAGNFYINDKPTGAVVGQQPFGGGRASGTNDKAGSALNLYRWVSPRCIKENFVPIYAVEYPYMCEE